MKTAMVLKAKDVIRRGCLEYDVSATDITSSFMAIRKTIPAADAAPPMRPAAARKPATPTSPGQPCTPC
ncbi:putative large terminase subunit [Escherichia coli p0305293.6]|nr:putative large terminase subunit [Escherichia coli p0305293.6]